MKKSNKLFIYVPNNKQIRKKGQKLARRDDYCDCNLLESCFVATMTFSVETQTFQVNILNYKRSN